MLEKFVNATNGMKDYFRFKNSQINIMREFLKEILKKCLLLSMLIFGSVNQFMNFFSFFTQGHCDTEEEGLVHG